jgi:outer membrane protein TolC
MAVLRFDANGNPDDLFSLDGKTNIDFSGTYDYAFGVAVQDDGKIVVAGSTDSNGQNDFAIVRLQGVCPDITFTQDISITEGQSFTVGNNTYTQEGTYEDMFLAVSGCDSLVVTTIEILTSVDVLNKALETAKENKRLADNSFKQGYLQRADVLNIEVRLTEVENQLQNAKSTIQNASDYVSFLMNDKTYIIYQPSDSLSIQTFNGGTKNGISENRADIKAMQLVSSAYEAMNKADKMAFLPRLNAFGSYEMYDNKIFQGGANGYLFGAQLSWDIFQGSKRFGKSQKSSAELEKSKLEYQNYVSQSNLELNKAKRMLIDAQNKLNLTSLAMEQSKESLRIRSNRFKEGLEKTSDLLLAEAQFAQKQLDYYQTIFEYNYAQAYLQFLTKE